MSREEIVAAIDEEISRLEKVRALLQGAGSSRLFAGAFTAGRKKRHLSAEARKRIAEAQKRRWAKQKKQAVATNNSK
jgi:hypothetical protein